MDECTGYLLVEGSAEWLATSLDSYPPHYDEVLNAVHERLASANEATKLDLAALIGWKHVRNAPWMRKLLAMPDRRVRCLTAGAFAPGLSDADRILAVRGLPGFGSGGAFTSVLLTAWDPTEFGVYDGLVASKRRLAVGPSCACDWQHLPKYWDHLRRMAQEMSATGAPWTPRMVDMAIMNLTPAPYGEDV
jgi:hypothetical protein